MLETLKFVQSAVARKDFVPTLTHFRIGGGTILGYNGEIAISNPIDLNLECCPKAVEFTKAIQTCREATHLQLTKGGKKLLVRSGSFSAYVPCLAEQYPAIVPEGSLVAIDGERLLTALYDLVPFIAEDASRPWARGILFRDGSAFATNNIVLVERWLGVTMPDINIPHETVKVLLKLDEPPTGLQVGKSSITFHYAGSRWVRCQLLTTEWPDLGSILNRPAAERQQAYSPPPVPFGFFQAVEDLLPFMDELERCFIVDNRLSTVVETDAGASVVVEGMQGVKACFNMKQLHRLQTIATSIDLAAYPAPSLFYGKEARGAIVGIHVEGFTP